jgi:SAM-dependent methyltransferase
MRHITHKNEFDLVINIFTSFGYFEKDADNQNVVKIISRALKPGGWFLIDFLNKYYVAKHLVPFDIKKEQKKIIIQIRRMRRLHVEKDILIFRNNRNLNSYPQLSRYREKIRVYSLNNFVRMFKSSGLRLVRVFGDYEGSNYNKNKSERLIVLAQKI